ncbi:hypothetical protein Tco_0547779, partial [Tanacetum coccineum]
DPTLWVGNPVNKVLIMNLPDHRYLVPAESKDDLDIIHVDNSSDLPLTTSLNDLEITALHIDGQLINVNAPPDIIDVNEVDDIINDEDVLPHDLADSDDEDLVNVDDDDADVARGHGDDGGGDDVPLHISKGTRKPNLGARKADRMHTRKETRNLRLRKITDELGPQPIRFKWKDNGIMLPLCDHSSHWANLLGEIMREFPMYFGSWRNIPVEQKARVLKKIGTQFDLKPHMQSELWPKIRKDIDQYLGKIYTDNKLTLKRDYWEGPYCTDLPTPDNIRRLLELERVMACRFVSSSSSHHQGTSSHQHDDDDDDVKTSRASNLSLTTYLDSINPLDYQNYHMPSSSE